MTDVLPPPPEDRVEPIGIEVDRIVYVFERLEASAQGDADDPGGQLGAQVEGMRLAPDDQHRVIEDFIDQLRPLFPRAFSEDAARA